MMKDLILVVGLCGESVFMKVDHFHQDGETIIVDELHKEPGGKGYNQAVTTKSLGVNTAFIGSIGHDDSGKMCSKYLDEMNIINGLITKNNCFSAYATILVDKNGNNNVSVYSGASTELTIDDIENNEHLFQRSKLLLLQFEISQIILEKCVEIAKKYDVKIIVNPAPYKEYGKNIIKDAFVITPNFHEAKTLFNLDNDITLDELASSLVNKNIKNIIVTLGKEGIMVIEDGESIYLPADIKDQNKVVDTTGAGDVFNGALAVGLYNNLTLLEAAKYAMKASSYSIQRKYVLPSIPKAEDING